MLPHLTGQFLDEGMDPEGPTGRREAAGSRRNRGAQSHDTDPPLPGCQLDVSEKNRYATESDVRRRSRAADSEVGAVEVG